jgi:hypothetical protein
MYQRLKMIWRRLFYVRHPEIGEIWVCRKQWNPFIPKLRYLVLDIKAAKIRMKELNSNNIYIIDYHLFLQVYKHESES